MEKPGESTGTVLVLVSGGRGLVSKLRRDGIDALACKTTAELIKRFDDSTDAIVLAEQALSQSKPAPLLRALKTQPPWSDVPVMLLTKVGRKRKKPRPHALELLETANVILHPIPVRIPSLLTDLRTAARTRRHQRSVRDLLVQRQAALASISDAFSILDRDWRYTYVNDRVLELTGKRKEELIGHVIWEIFPEAVGSEFY